MNIVMMPFFQSATRWTEIYTYLTVKLTPLWTGLVTLVDYTKDSHFCLDYWSQSSISITTRTIWFRTSSLKLAGKVSKLIPKILHRTIRNTHHKGHHRMGIKNTWIQQDWTRLSQFSMLWLEIGVRRGLIHQKAVVVEKLKNIGFLRKQAQSSIMKLILWDFYNILDLCATSQRT